LSSGFLLVSESGPLEGFQSFLGGCGDDGPVLARRGEMGGCVSEVEWWRFLEFRFEFGEPFYECNEFLELEHF